MSDSQIRISNLTKRYASGVTALKGISLDIPPGMFGLLGPNGAGKSTLMKILATLLEPDEGTVAMKGVDIRADAMAARRLLGYLPQQFGLYPTFTAEETLDYFARLKGVTNKEERESLLDALFERVNLVAERGQKVGGFSGGMRQRLGIAQALIGGPKVLIVDEPTAGLDPEERVRFHNLLAEIADDVVVILSTHIVSDVSSLCSRMAVIRRGEIIAQGSPQDAVERLAGHVWEAVVPREAVPAIKAKYQHLSSQMFEGRLRVRVISRGHTPDGEFSPVPPLLEDYYFSIINSVEKAN